MLLSGQIYQRVNNDLNKFDEPRRFVKSFRKLRSCEPGQAGCILRLQCLPNHPLLTATNNPRFRSSNRGYFFLVFFILRSIAYGYFKRSRDLKSIKRQVEDSGSGAVILAIDFTSKSPS